MEECVVVVESIQDHVQPRVATEKKCFYCAVFFSFLFCLWMCYCGKKKQSQLSLRVSPLTICSTYISESTNSFKPGRDLSSFFLTIKGQVIHRQKVCTCANIPKVDFVWGVEKRKLHKEEEGRKEGRNVKSSSIQPFLLGLGNTRIFGPFANFRSRPARGRAKTLSVTLGP